MTRVTCPFTSLSARAHVPRGMRLCFQTREYGVALFSSTHVPLPAMEYEIRLLYQAFECNQKAERKENIMKVALYEKRESMKMRNSDTRCNDNDNNND